MVSVRLLDLDRRLARIKLSEFTKQAWDIVNPGMPLIWNWHMDCVCDHVQALLEGKLGSNNLMINEPPGTSKSMLCNVMAPAWWWIDHPWWSAIYAAGAEEISLRDSGYCRDVITSDWYLDSFQPEWRIAKNQNAKSHYATTAKGFRLATTAGSKITGQRPMSLWIDDPLDAADAYSKAARDQILTWYRTAFGNRLASMEHGTRVLIMQRLHEEDLTGWLLKEMASEWEAIIVPMEFEESRRKVTSIGWVDPRTVEGELLDPARFPQKVLDSERIRLGASGYDGQMQQRPSAAMGEIFKRGYLKFWPREAPIQFTRVIQSWDTAAKAKAHNDASCGLQIGEFEQGYVLMDRRKERLTYPALKELARVWAQANPIDALVIEDKSSGEELIQEFHQSTSLPVVPWEGGADKIVYANVCVPTWEAGRVYVYDDCPWANDFLDEVCAFPNGAHDDQVDAFTHAIIFLIRAKPGQGIIDFYNAQLAAAKLAPADEPKPGLKVVDPFTRKNLAMDIINANR
jgi:predicted phage terminase large subunit-like protein